MAEMDEKTLKRCMKQQSDIAQAYRIGVAKWDAWWRGEIEGPGCYLCMSVEEVKRLSLFDPLELCEKHGGVSKVKEIE